MKRRFLSEQKLVVILFVMVFVIFSLAQEDTKKIEKMYQAPNTTSAKASIEVQKNIPIRLKKEDNIIPAADLR